MPGRVEQVEDNAIFLECHHRRGYRNAALLFNLHPVRTRAPSLPARLHFTGQVNRAALQQQFLRQRSLTRVRVGNNSKGPAVQRHAARLRDE